MKHRVGRNAVFNVAGVVLPTVVGIISVPILLQNLGASRLGIFTLALGIIGFAGVFDLGLGRALTQSVATATGQGRTLPTIARHVRRTLPIVGLMGLAWGAALWLMADAIAVSVFRLEGDIAREAALGIRWLGIAVPALLLSSSMVGVLEGLQRFGLVNLFRVPLNALTFIIPTLTSYIWQDVGHVIATLVIVRLVGVVIWALALNHVLPLGKTGSGEDLPARAMWRFTGWLSVSNIIGPLMVYADRYYLAALFPPATVAYYTVPLDTLFRATGLPLAAMNAVFPALAHSGVHSRVASHMIRGASWFLLGFWAIPLLVVGWGLETLLTLWLGAEFAAMSLDISLWLLFAVLINGFAHLPYGLLQSAGRADLTAKLHVLEMPIYAALLFTSIQTFGILGAAIAWTSRVALDAILLYYVAYLQFPSLRYPMLQAASIVVTAALIFWLITLT
jgi:O-antigen/teichoic acid export membrane protein